MSRSLSELVATSRLLELRLKMAAHRCFTDAAASQMSARSGSSAVSDGSSRWVGGMPAQRLGDYAIYKYIYIYIYMYIHIYIYNYSSIYEVPSGSSFEFPVWP